MVRTKLFFAIVVSFVMLSSCEESVTPPNYQSDQTELEVKLTGTWKYQSIYVGGEYFIAADSVMNPAKGDLNHFGGARAYLFRREIQYREDGLYQLIWEDRGKYALGTQGHPNDQPNFGNWRIDNSTDTLKLIHNPHTDQETVYEVELTDTSMVRRHMRYMSRPSSECGAVQAFWEAGDYVWFEEVFEKIK